MAIATSILALLGLIGSIILYVMRGAPARQLAELEKQKKQLEADYEFALKNGDTIAMAACQRRLLDLKAAAASITRQRNSG